MNNKRIMQQSLVTCLAYTFVYRTWNFVKSQRGTFRAAQDAASGTKCYLRYWSLIPNLDKNICTTIWLTFIVSSKGPYLHQEGTNDNINYLQTFSDAVYHEDMTGVHNSWFIYAR